MFCSVNTEFAPSYCNVTVLIKSKNIKCIFVTLFCFYIFRQNVIADTGKLSSHKTH